MARYRVQGPDGAIHVFEGPDGASQDDVLAFAQQHFAAPAAAPAALEKPGTLANAAAGAATGVADVGNTLINLGTRLAPTIEDPSVEFLTKGIPKRADLERMNAARRGLQDDFNKEHAGTAFDVGRLAGNVAITAPVGGAVGGAIKGLSGAPAVQALGNAVSSGGFRTGAPLGRVADVGARAAGGAISGGSGVALLDPDHIASGAAAGAALPLVLRGAGSVAKGAFGAAKGLIEPLYEGGRQAIAGRTLTRAAGAEAPVVAQRLADAAAPAVGPFQPSLVKNTLGEMVPGSMPTAAQVAENGGIAALERSIAASDPAAFATRGMEQASARLGALRDIAGTDEALAAATAARGTRAGRNYGVAFRVGFDEPMVAALQPQIESLMRRPSIQKAKDAALKLAAEDDVALTDMGSVQGMHYLKMALDDLAAGAVTNPTKQRLITQTAGDLQSVLEQIAPHYRRATERFARDSQPINQMEVGRELLDRVRPALADHGALAKETGANYAQALRTSDRTAQRATGLSNATLERVMSPEQMAMLNNIGGDLARKANAQDLGRGVGSDTFQKLALGNIAEQSGAPRATNAVLGLPIVSKLARGAYSYPETQIKSVLAQALLDPSIAANLMQRGTVAGTSAPSLAARALGGRQLPQLSADQTQMISDLFARAAPIALAR